MMQQGVVVVGLVPAMQTARDGGNMDELISRALNHAARRVRTEGSKAIRAEINLKSSYLDGPDGKLRITTPSTARTLHTEVRGEFRATSLARFVTNSARPAQKGARRGPAPVVQVKAFGARVQMKSAFVIKLKSGNAAMSDAFNMGLALRVKPGETVRNKKEMVKLGKNLFLLYGPSVDQVFRSMLPEANDIAIRAMTSEFDRLLEVNL